MGLAPQGLEFKRPALVAASDGLHFIGAILLEQRPSLAPQSAFRAAKRLPQRKASFGQCFGDLREHCAG